MGTECGNGGVSGEAAAASSTSVVDAYEVEAWELGAARIMGLISVGCTQVWMSSRCGDGGLSQLREAVRLRDRLARWEGIGRSVGVGGAWRGETDVGRGTWRGERVGVWAQRVGYLRRMGERLRDSE